MDFKRIQIIFLITFVIIDVFLFSLFHRNQSIQTENLSNGNQAGIVAEMRNDQITFRHRPSGHAGNGYYLAAKKGNNLHMQMPELSSNHYVHFVNHRIVSQFRHPVDLSSEHPHRSVNRRLSDPTFVIHGDQYRYSSDLSDHDNLVYVQKTPANAGRNAIFSKTAQIKFHVDGHFLTGYSQNYVSQVKTLREKSGTISSERALTWLYQYNNIPNDTQIEWCHFAYTRLLSVKGNNVYIPTWVVALKPSNSAAVQYRYVNAFNGSIINSSGHGNDLSNTSSD